MPVFPVSSEVFSLKSELRVPLRQLRLYLQKLGRAHQVPLIQRVQDKGLEGAVRGGHRCLGFIEASGR